MWFVFGSVCEIENFPLSFILSDMDPFLGPFFVIRLTLSNLKSGGNPPQNEEERKEVYLMEKKINFVMGIKRFWSYYWSRFAICDGDLHLGSRRYDPESKIQRTLMNWFLLIFWQEKDRSVGNPKYSGPLTVIIFSFIQSVRIVSKKRENFLSDGRKLFCRIPSNNNRKHGGNDHPTQWLSSTNQSVSYKNWIQEMLSSFSR